MRRFDNRGLVAAVLMAGVLPALIAPAPAPAERAACECCDSGLCRLATGGCDHSVAGAQGQLTSCCVRAPEAPATAPAGPSRLGPAVLPIASRPPSDRRLAWRSVGAWLLPAAPAPTPERPPPRRSLAPLV